MAEVKMDLAELKKIEDEVVIQKAKVAKKEEEIVNLKLTLKEVEANKRIVQKTIIKGSDRISTININTRKLADDILRNPASYSSNGGSRESGLAYAIRTFLPMAIDNDVPYHSRMGYGNDYVSISGHNGRFQDEETTEYINFEDVQRDLREKAESAVSKELGTLRDKAQQMESRITQIKSEHKESNSKFLKEKIKDIEALENAHRDKENSLQKEINNWEKKYEDLRLDKDTRATEIKLQEEIDNLKLELEKERRKPWWKKIFG